MPHSEIHKRKLRKNIALLALLLGWCALIWGVTMVKIAHGHDIEQSFGPQRETHFKNTGQDSATYKKDGTAFVTEGNATAQSMKAAGGKHNEVTNLSRKSWDESWDKAGPQREMAEKINDQQRLAHEKNLRSSPENWWGGWDMRLRPDQ